MPILTVKKQLRHSINSVDKKSCGLVPIPRSFDFINGPIYWAVTNLYMVFSNGQESYV